MKPTTDPSKVVSPKVIAPAIAAGIALVVYVSLAAITPDLLTFAGPWSVVLFAAIQGAAQVVAGYVKRDPLRRG